MCEWTSVTDCVSAFGVLEIEILGVAGMSLIRLFVNGIGSMD